MPAARNATVLQRSVLVGLAAGLLGGMFGVGGGLVIVPGLMALVGMERRLAHGTSLAAALPIGLASMITYLAHGHVDWPVALVLAAGAIAGAVLGTHLLRVIPKNLLVVIFAVTVLATATRLLIGDEPSGRSDLTVAAVVLMALVGFLAGTLAGLLGIGGGVIMVPAMVVLLGMPTVVAKGTSAAVIVPTALMGTLRNRKHANTDLRVAAVVGVFGAATAVVGGTIADRLSDGVANALFAVLLVFVAVTQLLSLRPSAAARPDVAPIGDP